MSEQGERADIKVGVGRSPAYPYIPLARALERVEQVRAAGATRQAMTPETFYSIWKLGSASSGARQTLAALNHFGLVDYIGRGNDKKVRLSDLAQRIALDSQPVSPERDALIRSAALTPPIHRELFDKYGPLLPADVVIKTFLERDMGYNQSAAEALIKEYQDTLIFSGLDKPDSMPAEPVESRPPEAGIPMETQRPPEGAGTRFAPPPPVEAGPEEVMRGRLGPVTFYRLQVEGPFDAPQINTLIRLLEAQRDVLEPTSED